MRKDTFLNDGDSIRSVSTGLYHMIYYNPEKGWYKYPVGGFTSKTGRINYYEDFDEFVETELWFEYEIIKGRQWI